MRIYPSQSPLLSKYTTDLTFSEEPLVGQQVFYGAEVVYSNRGNLFITVASPNFQTNTHGEIIIIESNNYPHLSIAISQGQLESSKKVLINVLPKGSTRPLTLCISESDSQMLILETKLGTPGEPNFKASYEVKDGGFQLARWGAITGGEYFNVAIDDPELCTVNKATATNNGYIMVKSWEESKLSPESLENASKNRKYRFSYLSPLDNETPIHIEVSHNLPLITEGFPNETLVKLFDNQLVLTEQGQETAQNLLEWANEFVQENDLNQIITAREISS